MTLQLSRLEELSMPDENGKSFGNEKSCCNKTLCRQIIAVTGRSDGGGVKVHYVKLMSLRPLSQRKCRDHGARMNSFTHQRISCEICQAFYSVWQRISHKKKFMICIMSRAPIAFSASTRGSFRASGDTVQWPPIDIRRVAICGTISILKSPQSSIRAV